MNKYTPTRGFKVTGQNFGRSGSLVTLPLYALQHMPKFS